MPVTTNISSSPTSVAEKPFYGTDLSHIFFALDKNACSNYNRFMNKCSNDSTRYIEINVKAALTRVNNAYMPDMKWSLNPYRGCKHGCVYCYARYTHEFLELDPGAGFSQTVFVKRNLVQALRADLRRPTWRREKVHIGTATDPYQPAEGRYQLTRGVLMVLRDQLTPAGLVTKNTMALRDAEIMLSLAESSQIDPRRLVQLLTQARSGMRVTPDHKIYAPAPGPEGGATALFDAAHGMMKRLGAS